MSRRSPSSRDSRRGRRLLAVAAVLAALPIASGVIGDSDESVQVEKVEPARPFTVGRGARSARVLPARGAQPRAAVVFLHGWGLTGPKAYDGWLRHLTERGSTVIVPRYQTSVRTSSETVAENALAGVRAALRRLRTRPRRVVVLGHSAGGILAVDYAARAESLDLPGAASLMIVYPGGAIRDMPPVPEEDPSSIPASVRRLLVLASPTDDVVGTAPAQAIHDGAVNVPEQRRQLVAIDDPEAGDHFAPALDSPSVRREFWSRLDRLIRLAG